MNQRQCPFNNHLYCPYELNGVDIAWMEIMSRDWNIPVTALWMENSESLTFI